MGKSHLELRIPSAVRATVRNVLGPRVIRYIRHLGIPKASNIRSYQQLLIGRRALEIGGPSEMFAYDGPLPIYPILRSVDNCLFSRHTIWTGPVTEEFWYDANQRRGTQFFCEATSLNPIADGSYDCVLACHCLEHSANPIKVLRTVQRVLNSNGLLLAVLPDKDATFDWRRPLTPLSHLAEDYRNNIAEDDPTHLPEVLALHDLERDTFRGSMEDFRECCFHNYSVRIMHHHTFNAASAVAMVEFAGFRAIRVETVKPCNIIVVAQPAPD